MTEPIISRSIVKYTRGKESSAKLDDIAVEEPLEIRLNNKSISITMRTPGDDFCLAAGFLFSEGVIRSTDDIENIRFCGLKPKEATSNIVRVTLKANVIVDALRLDRHFYASSACGVCGKSSLEALAIHAEPFSNLNSDLTAETICELPERLKLSQTLFHRTGGIHAAGLFDTDGTLLHICEDVGRHNAVDKLIGRQVLARSPILGHHVMCISGRASFEILQKAIVARISTIVAVGAPSSLAIELAERFNVTLIGFADSHRFNVYTGKSSI